MSNCEWCGENADYIKETGEMEDLLCGACLNFYEQGLTYNDLLSGKYKEGSDEIEWNQIDNVEIKITFLDGTSKTFHEDDIGENFSDWLSDVNYDKRTELEEE